MSIGETNHTPYWGDDLITYVIGQLRGACWEDEAAAVEALVDHIEQLERENAEMAAAISDAENGGICSGGNLWRFWSRTAREAALARADERSASGYKLAKAVETLRWYADFGNYLSIPANGSYPPIDLDKGGRAEDALAELEGKND
jgi:hypothetical protein